MDHKPFKKDRLVLKVDGPEQPLHPDQIGTLGPIGVYLLPHWVPRFLSEGSFGKLYQEPLSVETGEGAPRHTLCASARGRRDGKASSSFYGCICRSKACEMRSIFQDLSWCPSNNPDIESFFTINMAFVSIILPVARVK